MSSPRNTVRIPIRIQGNAAVAVATRPIHVDGNPMELHVLVSANNLFELEGSLDGVNWADLYYDNIVGAYFMTVMNTLAVGYYKVHERPKYVRGLVAIDQNATIYYAVLLVKNNQ